MAKVLVNELFNVPEFESQEQKINKIFDRLEARVNKMNSMGGEALNNSSFAGNIENIKKMQAEFEKLTNDLRTYTVEVKKTNKEKSQSDKEYVDTWKYLLRQKDDEEKATLKAQQDRDKAASEKRIADAKAESERKNKNAKDDAILNKMIAKEEADERKRMNLEKINSDKAYAAMYKTLLKERDAEEKRVASARATEGKLASALVAADSNIALSKTLNDLRLGYDKLTAAERANEQIGGVLVKRIKEIDTQLKETDAMTGRFQRRVGEYTMATNGLGRSLQGLLREVPSVRSLDQLFLSWSNQLPMVGDEIAKVRKEVAAMKAEGKATAGVFETSLRSIVNWQTLLVVGTIILTQYGAKIVEFMQKIVVGTNDAEKAQDALNKAYSDSSVTSAIENVNKLRTDLQLAKEGVIDKDKVLKEYNETIGKTTGEVKSLDEAEKDLGKNAQAYIQFTLLKAASNYALQESAKKSVEAVIQQQKTMDAAGKVVPGSTNPVAVTQMLFGAISAKSAKQDADQLLNIGENFRKDAAALSKKYGFDFFGGTENAKKEKLGKDNNEILKQEIANQKAIFDTEENSYEMRLGAMDAYFELKNELNKREGKDDIAFKHELDLEETKMNKKLADDLEKIRLEAVKKKEKEDKDELDRLDKLSKAKYATIQQGLNDVELAAKAEGLSAEEVYQKKMDYLVMHMNDLGLNAEEQKKIIEAAQNYEIKVIEETQKAKDKANAHELANKKRLYNDLKRLGQETFQFINTLISASIDRQIRDLEKQDESNTEYYASKRDAIERSTMLERDKIEATMVLADQEKQEKLKIQADIAAAKQKQARIDKAIALGTIAINTATAISKAVAEFPITGGLPFSAIAAAIGLAQAAVVLATPIPEYSTGVKADDPYNGLAWISEKNEAELKIDKDGTMRLYTEPTMIYKQQGDTILSNKELQQVLKPSQDGTVNKISYDELIRANAAQLKQQTKELASVLRETAKSNDYPAILSYQKNMDRARA